MKFLSGYDFNPIHIDISVKNFITEGLFLGKGRQALEIVVLRSQEKPNSKLIQQIFNKRRDGRAAPILLVIIFPKGITLCGTNGTQPPIYELKDLNQVERLCASALNKPDRNTAISYLSNTIPSLETELPGFRNEGFLSFNELIKGPKKRKDWEYASNKGHLVLEKKRDEIFENFGFTSKKLDNYTNLLTYNEERIALGIILSEDEIPNAASSRFNNISPINYAFIKADNENLSWILLIQEDRVRLYNTRNIGVGRRNRTETYIESQISIIASEDAGLLWLLFSGEALREEGTIFNILEDSKRFAASIAERLRERIYEIVIPKLTLGISKARHLINPEKKETELTYEMALTVLFRLLFIAYAEDRDLLPYKNNEFYKKRSLKQKAIELAEASTKRIPISPGYHHWNETISLWDSVSKGNKEWGVPAYGGTIFSNDPKIYQAGAELDKISLENEYFEEALRYLLLSESKENEYSPIDFRSLSVREFGTIYEGLLVSELSLANQNLTIDKDNNYLPAREGEKIIVMKGDTYLHNRSGARKSSGSYYTPDFAVEHLLDEALEPAIKKHFEKLTTLSDADKADKFFKFHVADIAMGSGHFLVAAIDRIEFHFAKWLEQNPIPSIKREIQFLREASKNELGELADTLLIEDSQLLRRLIARRCIFGVDLNPLSVQLARLSIWIHTFVPGLPLSLLDRNLIHGNSLIGVESLDIVYKKFNEGENTLLSIDANKLLGDAAEPLKKLALLSESSIKDIKEGRKLIYEANKNTEHTKALFDLITAQPLANKASLKGYLFENWELQKDEVFNSSAFQDAQEILKPLNPVHFPISFPEVFLDNKAGFNVILGNPPWESIKVEEQKFWARHFPGLRSKNQRDFEAYKINLYSERPDLLNLMNFEKSQKNQMRKIILSGSYPGIGKGDPDLYKAFAWRFLNLCSKNLGFIGIVLPRSAISSNGSEQFRKGILKQSNSMIVTLLQNTGKWVFDIHPQFTVALISISKSSSYVDGIFLKGPFNSFKNYKKSKSNNYEAISVEELESWSEDGAFPLLPFPESLEVFRQLKRSPSIAEKFADSWIIKPRRELDASLQKNLMDLKSKDCPKGFYPIYKGASFDIWNPDQNDYYAWGDPKILIPFLRKKEKNRAERELYKYDETKVHAEKPRISFRLITNRTNRRTLIPALIPPNVFQQHSVQFIEFIRGNEKDEAFLLGCLSSIPLDWYSRKFVEINFTFNYFNSLPIPRPKDDDPLKNRLVEISSRLAATDNRFSQWAEKVGTKCGLLSPEDKENLIEELDAVVAHLYGLSEKHLIHIFKTFHEGWNYEMRLNKVLSYYHKYI